MASDVTDPLQLALDLGFDVARVCRADEAWAAGERLEAFVASGHHGTMAWFEETLERRKAPTAMWPEAKSALVVAMNYGPETDPIEDLKSTTRANISVYARHRDYHDVMKKRLKALARTYAEKTGHQVKVFVDTAPLMEKPLAAKAGVGWQGKHTNLVSREWGSWLFLGVMLTDAELTPDAPETDHCGSCRACLDICPTDAFPAPYRLDARRCISYLTIEHAGPIPSEFRAAMGNRIYGCDDCLAVCPWNKFASEAAEAKLAARDDLKAPALGDLIRLDDAAFRERFAGSPIKRIGRDRFIRNVAIAAGNSGDETLRQDCKRLTQDGSPLVRGAAIWALSQLRRDGGTAELARDRLSRETDQEVRAEWQHIIDEETTAP